MAAPGKKPYFAAAMFYYAHDLDLKKAVGWIDEAIKEQPDALWMIYRKGLILAKMGDKKGAVAAAQQSLELAEKAGGAMGAEYKHLNETLIASLQ
jgi:tetratricopeptide (TPR) repeat protein